ncbi:hypothetical protein [Blautia argi]|uniref:Uncharacterized protein n=1 Tax=Blautia argi TaxID=1912897 RepID=A0A2Z4U8K8_9FIRM|nr:hypothetical protein [Blautia argi]AWY97330.1 hypothetical protein DQQ01_03235 [Blautia argi]
MTGVRRNVYIPRDGSQTEVICEAKDTSKCGAFMSDRLLSGRYRNLSKTVSWKWFGFVYVVLKV